MMSASRIWPVVGFTRDGPIAKPTPAVIQRIRVVANVARLPRRIIRLLPHFDRVVEARLLERLVPLQNAVANRLAILERNRLLQPEDDRLLGRRHLRARIGLLQVPPRDVPHEPVVVALLLGEILEHREEVADAVVRQPRLGTTSAGSSLIE